MKLRDQYSIAELCEAFGVSRAGFYAFERRPRSTRAKENSELVSRMREIREETEFRSYGSPRMTKALVAEGYSCSENRVASLMRKEGLQATKKRPFRPRTTQFDGNESRIAPNRLSEAPAPSRPGEALVSDITYVATREGWLYLAVIIDLYTRLVVGWSLADRMDASLVTRALKSVPPSLRSEEGFFHSDRGCQYTCNSTIALISDLGMIRSMSAKGDCYDNAYAESFFATLKTEGFPESGVFDSKVSAKKEIFKYIESFYNTRRLHSSLGYISPLQFLKNHLKSDPS